MPSLENWAVVFTLQQYICPHTRTHKCIHTDCRDTTLLKVQEQDAVYAGKSSDDKDGTHYPTCLAVKLLEGLSFLG